LESDPVDRSKKLLRSLTFIFGRGNYLTKGRSVA
jgi:hypothetical protein